MRRVVALLPRPFSKPLRLSRIACGDRAAARRIGVRRTPVLPNRLWAASLTAAAVWKFRRQELDGEARSASVAPASAGRRPVRSPSSRAKQTRSRGQERGPPLDRFVAALLAMTARKSAEDQGSPLRARDRPFGRRRSTLFSILAPHGRAGPTTPAAAQLWIGRSAASSACSRASPAASPLPNGSSHKVTSAAPSASVSTSTSAGYFACAASSGGR